MTVRRGSPRSSPLVLAVVAGLAAAACTSSPAATVRGAADCVLSLPVPATEDTFGHLTFVNYDEARRESAFIDELGLPPVTPMSDSDTITNEGYPELRRNLPILPATIQFGLANNALTPVGTRDIRCSLSTEESSREVIATTANAASYVSSAPFTARTRDGYLELDTRQVDNGSTTPLAGPARTIIDRFGKLGAVAGRIVIAFDRKSATGFGLVKSGATMTAVILWVRGGTADAEIRRRAAAAAAASRFPGDAGQLERATVAVVHHVATITIPLVDVVKASSFQQVHTSDPIFAG